MHMIVDAYNNFILVFSIICLLFLFFWKKGWMNAPDPFSCFSPFFSLIFLWFYFTLWKTTTTLSSFTDGLIPSVIAMKSVGERNTDGIYPSVNQSSVNPISVANSVANKKNHPLTETPTVIQTDTRANKKFLAGKLPTANPSVILRVITDGITTGSPSVCMAWLVILLQLSV